MIAFVQNQTLQKGDLTIMVRDAQGNPVAPAALSYSIFNTTSNPPVLVSNPKDTPASDPSQVGYFYINLTFPTNWAPGTYRLVWYLTQYLGSTEVTIYEDFEIIAASDATTNASLEAPSIAMVPKPGISPNVANLIVLVRELLSDTNPDRNYHFRPPTAGKTIAGFSSRVGFIWEDRALIRFLNLAVAKINSANPMNFYSYTPDTIPDSWLQAAALGAAAFALMAEAIRWNAEEFSYSLNGVSLDINKAQMYQSLAATYTEEFNQWAEVLTVNRPASSGLRQQRWLLG